MNGFLAVIGVLTFFVAGYFFVSWEKKGMDVPKDADGLHISVPSTKEEADPPEKKNGSTKKAENVNGGDKGKPVMDLMIEKIREGEGERKTKLGDTIAVHYTGTLLDGTKFDSSVDRGEPFEFQLGSGMVIAGWDQGLLDMKIGEKRKLTIPSSLGYGSRAIGSIPADSTLVFETELIGIK